MKQTYTLENLEETARRLGVAPANLEQAIATFMEAEERRKREAARREEQE